jgi:hypothetical protein
MLPRTAMDERAACNQPPMRLYPQVMNFTLFMGVLPLAICCFLSQLKAVIIFFVLTLTSTGFLSTVSPIAFRPPRWIKPDRGHSPPACPGLRSLHLSLPHTHTHTPTHTHTHNYLVLSNPPIWSFQASTLAIPTKRDNKSTSTKQL